MCVWENAASARASRSESPRKLALVVAANCCLLRGRAQMEGLPSGTAFASDCYSLRRFLEFVKQSTWAAHDVVACIDVQDFTSDTAAVSTQ